MTKLSMKKLAVVMAGIGLTVMTAAAIADESYTTYYAQETGIVSDHEGRTYTYVIYGTTPDSTRVTSAAVDVNSDSRGATPVDPQKPAAMSDEAPAPVERSASNSVSVSDPDVNRVQGRA